MNAYEKELILDALDRSEGVHVDAAKRLNIPISTLRYKMRKHNIKVSSKDYH